MPNTALLLRTDTQPDGLLQALQMENWIVIQGNHNSSNFSRPWVEFKTGFGQVNSSYYWMGLDRIGVLTQGSSSCRLRVEMLTEDGVWISAEYDQFRVDNESASYAAIFINICLITSYV